MAYEQKEGQGSLFKNEKKTADNQPDYTGNIMIDGVKKRIAAWLKKGNSGATFMSLQISEFQQTADHAAQVQQAFPGSTVDNDVPF